MTLKYYRTYGTMNLPEIWLILMTLVKITILLPNYFVHEINTMYCVFILNSYCSYFLTYIFAQRTCILLELHENKMRLNRIFFCIQIGLFTFMIFLYPFMDFDGTFGDYDFLLRCSGELIYPSRFLYIWLSDFICAFLSIMVIMYEKRFVSDKGRLRLARKMDI